MIPFFKYVQPIGNFALTQTDDRITYLNKVPNNLESFLNKNIEYKSNDALKLDLAYQLLISGYVNNNKKNKLVFDPSKISVNDNYKLIARFFNKPWLIITFIFRIIEMNNPFKEIIGFLSSLNTKKLNMISLKNKIKEDRSFNWNVFKSKLLASKPLLSVVIPTLNRYYHLKNLISDLEKQDYKNFEIIIIDQSDNFVEGVFNNDKLKINHIRQHEKALWRARNTGIKISKGDYILLLDDDVSFEDNFISNHLKAIDFFNCDISNGVFHSIGSKSFENGNFFGFSEQFPAGNTLLKKSVFKDIGLFDRQFEKQRMGDGEFGTRGYLNGIFSINNPLSACIDVKAEKGGLRDMGSWSSWRPKNFFSVRPIPSVLYYSRKYWGNVASIFIIFISLPISISPYKIRNKYYGYIISIFLFIILSPFFLFSLGVSWKRSTKMLMRGSLIDKLENN